MPIAPMGIGTERTDTIQSVLFFLIFVENIGLEPMTSTLPAWRSSQLS